MEGGLTMLTPMEIAELVRRELCPQQASPGAAGRALIDTASPCWVLVKPRQTGRQLDRIWLSGAGVMATLLQGLRQMHEAAAGYPQAPDVLEINVGHSIRRLSAEMALADLPQRDTGLKGLLLEVGGRMYGIGATEMISSNRNMARSRARLLEDNAVTDADLRAGRASLSLSDAASVLIYLGPPARASLLYRCGKLLRQSSMRQAVVRRLAADMSSWMRRQVGGDGRMVYKYWPSRGEESPAVNTIRQWMATVCLNRIARRSRLPGDREIADRNLAYNLTAFFRDEDGLGLIVEGDRVKLGAIALAALAIHENPDAGRFAEPFAKLLAAVDHLWRPDGSFRTFLRPAERNDNQSFYPGETLLLWATLMAARPDGALRARFAASFRYYRGWFERHRNPAFVPWHTQAYCLALRQGHDDEMASFVFEMNDWLLPMQQWDTARYPDLKGRFYDPKHPQYGPPHASSTGVYLEGLIEACALARRLGDMRRAERYRVAVLRALRNLRQLQFRSEDDMFYVSRRERVFGGLRTEAYDNTIRVDNVQHGLMGVQKVLDEFSEDDYLLEPYTGAQLSPTTRAG